MLRSFIFAALTFVLSGTAYAASIGVNFTATRFGGGPYPILPHETAGLVPQVNWNNSNPAGNGTTATIASPMPGKLVNNSGVDSGATIAWFNGNAEVNSDGGNTTPNERLYRGLAEGSAFMPPSPQLTVSMSNIPYAKYNVIAYLIGFGFDADSSVKLGTQEYYYIQSDNFTVDGFKKATATTFATRTLATYAIFENLTSSSFSMELIKRGGNRPGIGGLQVVAVPEPASWVMLAAGTVALTIIARRKRDTAGASAPA